MLDQLRQRPYIPEDRRWTRSEILQRLELFKEELRLEGGNPDSVLLDAAEEVDIAITQIKGEETAKADAALYSAIGYLMFADSTEGPEFLNQILDHLHYL